MSEVGRLLDLTLLSAGTGPSEDNSRSLATVRASHYESFATYTAIALNGSRLMYPNLFWNS